MFEISLLKFKPSDLKEFGKSEVIFEEGSFGSKMYFIFSGTVRIFTINPGREVTLGIIGPGEFFGEMALIDSSPRSATAVAEEDAKLLAVDKNQFMELIRTNPEFALLIIQNFSRRLRERWDLYQKMQAASRKKGQMELVLKSVHLDEINNALKFLRDQMKKDRIDSEIKIVSNVKQFVSPYIEKLALSRLDEQQKEWLSVIESNLNQIISPYIGSMPLKVSLTPTELQVANLIKDGKTSKEVSNLLNLSTTTVDFHRNNIRSKLGLTNRKTSIRAHLLSMGGED